MAVVYSIFHRLGKGGGGKVRAVQHRLNAFAEMRGFDPVLLNLDHHIRQRLNFAGLRRSGVLHPGVAYASLPDACLGAAVRAGIGVFTDYPAGEGSDARVSTSRPKGDDAVGMVVTKSYAAGKDMNRLTLLNGLPHQLEVARPDGSVVTTDFAAGRPIRRWRRRGSAFMGGTNLVTGAFHGMARMFEASLFELVDWTDSVVFFDGITSAYLAPFATPRSILFVHADHRNPDGTISARARGLIEGYQGAAIVTATEMHRRRLAADLVPARPVEVLPHFIHIEAHPAEPRRHLVTVSRLDLAGKPIDQAIRAFATIMDDFPGVDYLIHGDGAGEAQLKELIATLGCGDRVRLMGYTDAPLAVFRGALAAVCPTLTEGFGLSILEALSCGCPVISHDVDYGPGEMIDGRNGLLVPPGNEAALAAAMRRVLADPLPFQQATADGLDRYSRSRYLENYSRLALQVLHRTAAEPAPDAPDGSEGAQGEPSAPGRLDHYAWHDSARAYRLDR